MITRVHLKNWKAYPEFSLDLAPGTTFLVASNGVGKTSFIEAVQWALNSEARALRRFIRRGAKTASVEVDLAVGDHHVRIIRTLTLGPAKNAKTPTMSVDAWIDNVLCDNVADAFTLLAQQWKADNQFTSRAAFLSDRMLYDGQEPDLRAHLTQLHALDQLQFGIAALDSAIKTATNLADGARQGAQASREQFADAIELVRVTEADVERAVRAESDARAALAAAEGALKEGLAVADASRAWQRWQTERAAIVTAAAELIGEPAPEATSLIDWLRSSEAAARRQLLEQAELRARLVERIATVNEALERLRAAEGDCPVCRRPLDDASRGFAEAQHQHDREAASGELEDITVSETETFTDQLQALRERAERLGEQPPAPQLQSIDNDQLDAGVASAKQGVETAVADLREARLRAADAVSDRDGLAPPDEADESIRLYAKVAAMEAAREAMNNTITEVLDRQIGPVRDEVNRRWDTVFPDRPGLRLDADGQITRVFGDGDGDLEFDSFSSGEKVIAKLLLRLATLTRTTGLPFCWIDEPLEHLDPDARVFLAQTLAHLSGTGALRQIFVTTYETQLARELVADADEQVHLEMLTGAPAPV